MVRCCLYWCLSAFESFYCVVLRAHTMGLRPTSGWKWHPLAWLRGVTTQQPRPLRWKEENIISPVSDRPLSLMCYRKEAVISGFRRQVAEICALMENYSVQISRKGSFVPPSLSQDVSLQKMIRPRAELPGKGDPITVRGRDCFFSTASKSVLPSIQAYIQLVPAGPHLGVKRPESEADHQLVTRLRMCGAVPPLLQRHKFRRSY